MRKKIFDTYLIGYDEDHFEVKVMYDDIFLIEVIPYTHYCNVFYKNSKCKLYYDSEALMRNLGERFTKVSVSAIVRMDKVVKIDKKLHYLFFKNNLYVPYVPNYWQKIKADLSICSYRTNAYEGQEKTTYIFAYSSEYVFHKIEKTSIYYILSIGGCHRCELVSRQGTYEIKGSLSTIEEELPEYFLKCKRNCVVNMNYVTDINKEEKILQVESGDSCGYEKGREGRLIAYFERLKRKNAERRSNREEMERKIE